MDLRIRPLRDTDIERVVELSLLAWAPVFASWEEILGPDIFPIVFPDWRKTQAESVESALRDAGKHAVCGELGGTVVAFLVYELSDESGTGEIYMVAVHPDYQGRGFGVELNQYALDRMKEAGMKVAYVGTGGDPGHAPARRSYEKVGFNVALPGVHYYKRL